MTRTLAVFDAAHLNATWVDIEDHDEVLGDLDVESFPSLLIARGAEVLFFGTVPPHAQTLERLVQGALAGDLPRLPFDAEVQALVANVQAFRAASG